MHHLFLFLHSSSFFFLLKQSKNIRRDLNESHVFVRFLFTDYNRLSSVGGETSMAEMIATLSDACEREFGFLATRLFRVFKTEETQGKRHLFLPKWAILGHLS